MAKTTSVSKAPKVIAECMSITAYDGSASAAFHIHDGRPKDSFYIMGTFFKVVITDPELYNYFKPGKKYKLDFTPLDSIE